MYRPILGDQKSQRKKEPKKENKMVVVVNIPPIIPLTPTPSPPPFF
jgi:hypothetical protein